VFQAFVLKTAVNDAICATLPVGSVGYEAEPNERGERLIWIEDAMGDQLGAMRGPGESYNDVRRRGSGRQDEPSITWSL
jgi:hypothetical protein